MGSSAPAWTIPVDEGSGTMFCLVEASSKEAAAAVYREAHGLVADEITEVREGA